MNTHPTTPSPSCSMPPEGLHWERIFRHWADALAVDPVKFAQHLTFESRPEGYQRAVLHRDPDAEIIAMRWPQGVASILHGHGASAVWLRMLAGELGEDRFLPMGRDLVHQRVVLRAGDTAYLPRGALHRIESRADALALHAYSPPLGEPATPPDALQQQRLVAAWHRSEAALRGEPVPDFVITPDRRNPA